MGELSDNALIQRIKSDDFSAYEILYRRYVRRIYSFIFKMLNEHSETEELVQEVFVILWEKRGQICCDYKFSNYLFTISYNAVLKNFRCKKAERKALDNMPCGMQICADTLSTINYNEMAVLIAATVEGLPEKRKLVFKLSREKGMTTREIAENLSISPRTVETHISKALQIIRKALKDASLI